MSKKVTIQAYQNIIDVCLQEYGSTEFLYAMHLENGLQEFPALTPAGSALVVYPENITGSKRAIAILQQYIPGTGYGMNEPPTGDALFHDGYMHPDNYLFPESYLKIP